LYLEQEQAPLGTMITQIKQLSQAPTQSKLISQEQRGVMHISNIYPLFSFVSSFSLPLEHPSIASNTSVWL
jgi:hypothetical protein